MNKILIIIALTLVFIGCKTNKNTESVNVSKTDETELTVDEPRYNTSILEIHTDENETIQDTGDAFQILKAVIDQDILSLEVSYGGGCEEHSFIMQLDHTYMNKGENTSTKTVQLILHHNGNNDRCRSIVRQNLRFNLKPIQNSKYKKLRVLVNNQESLIYKF